MSPPRFFGSSSMSSSSGGGHPARATRVGTSDSGTGRGIAAVACWPASTRVMSFLNSRADW